MARTTTNYGFNISEGTDPVNPLVDIFPNWEALDSDLKDVSDEAVGVATELTTGTVHALTRSDTSRNIIRFTATSNFTAGDTFTVDGTQVSALTPDGQTLSTGCYVIGAEVLAILKSTLLTVYVSPAKALDSDKLDGNDSTYYATAQDVSDLDGTVTTISSKVGSGVLTTTAQDCVGGINELNADLTPSDITYTPVSGWNPSDVESKVSANNLTLALTFNNIGIITQDTNRPIKIGTLAMKPYVLTPIACYNMATATIAGDIAAWVDTNGDVYWEHYSSGTKSVDIIGSFLVH